MTPRLIRKHCRLDSACEQLVENAMNRIGLSARPHDRILKVTRTIADLEGVRRSRPNTSPKPSSTARSTARIGRECAVGACFSEHKVIPFNFGEY
jgi:hypothetical protein